MEILKKTFRNELLLYMLTNSKTIRSDEGLALETSAFESLNGG